MHVYRQNWAPEFGSNANNNRQTNEKIKYNKIVEANQIPQYYTHKCPDTQFIIQKYTNLAFSIPFQKIICVQGTVLLIQKERVFELFEFFFFWSSFKQVSNFWITKEIISKYFFSVFCDKF